MVLMILTILYINMKMVSKYGCALITERGRTCSFEHTVINTNRNNRLTKMSRFVKNGTHSCDFDHGWWNKIGKAKSWTKMSYSKAIRCTLLTRVCLWTVF